MLRRVLLVMGILTLSIAALPPRAQAQTESCGKGSQVAGAIVGGIVGALFGRAIDGGRNRSAGTLIGGALGVFIGSKIAKSLDKCEQQKMAKATQDALDSKASGEASEQAWASDSRAGVAGKVTASAPTTLPDGRICRTATQVNYVDGQELQDNPQFCRTPSSPAWTPA